MKNRVDVLEGYVKGAEVARNVVDFALKAKIPNLTLYTLSTENLSRPKAQIDFLFGIFEKCLIEQQAKLKTDGVSIKVIGDIECLPASLKKAIQVATEPGAQDPKLHLYVAFNYGGRQEILRAHSLALEASRKGETQSGNIEKHLYAPEMPDLDLVIRTGGTRRISNFLLWKIAYSELCFLDVLWPDTKLEDLIGAIEKFQASTRTLGVKVHEGRSW